MRKQKVYIAGPMTGIQGFNFPAFDAARDKLEAEGFEVLSPADLEREEHPEIDYASYDGNTPPPRFHLEETAFRDLEAVAECGNIFLLKGWEKSKGARAEKSMAEWLGKTIRYEEGHRFMHLGGYESPDIQEHTTAPDPAWGKPFGGFYICAECGKHVENRTSCTCAKLGPTDPEKLDKVRDAKAGNPENKGVEGGKPSNTENPKDEQALGETTAVRIEVVVTLKT